MEYDRAIARLSHDLEVREWQLPDVADVAPSGRYGSFPAAGTRRATWTLRGRAVPPRRRHSED